MTRRARDALLGLLAVHAATPPARAGQDPDLREPPPAPRPATKPLAAPKPDEQQPGPVPHATPRAWTRHLDIGPDAGLVARAAEGDGIGYRAGPAWGAHVRLELWRALGLRLVWTASRHDVTAPAGSLGELGAVLEPPGLDAYTLGARLEPTWALGRVRLFAGLGVAWGRATHPAWSGGGAAVPVRHGVFLALPDAALGASVELLPRWLDLGSSVSGALIGDESGALFEVTPVIRDGALAEVAALPGFSASATGLLWVALVR